LILASVLAAVLAPQQPATLRPDLVRLEVGTELEGRIVVETADYVEIELGPGTTVGLARSKIASIEHGDGPRSAAGNELGTVRADEAPAVSRGRPALRARDDWHVLHDADGRSVGWMHATVQPDGDGGLRIGEEWQFGDGSGTVETTVLELLDADGRPVSAFSHARRRGPDGRLSADRVVRASIDGGLLRVQTRSNQGTEQRSYHVADGVRFPLELREELRGRPAGTLAREAFPVFDPLVEDFELQSFAVGGTRRLALGRDDASPVRVLTAQGARGENSEWLDASARPLRREIAGPALVAVRVADEAAAKAAAHAAKTAFPPAFRAEAGGRFGLWAASPAWQFVEAEQGGSITLRSALDDASLALIRLDHLAPDLGLQSAADAVLRWLQLGHRDLRVGARTVQRIRGTDAVRIRAGALRGDGQAVELLVHVLQVEGAFFASCAAAPRAAFTRLEAEIEWMVERFELRREGFAPQRQGPFAPRPRR
jgi:hypothetical protein